MKPTLDTTLLLSALAGYKTARKAAAEHLATARSWVRLQQPKHAINAASRSGWWRRTAEEWAKQLFLAWRAEA